MKKIYITGIAGMLGYGIYNTLKDRAEIFGIDIVNIEVPSLSYPKISLYETDAVEQNILQIQPDVLIHTAAWINVEECEENPAEAARLNTQVTAQLADICHKHHIKMVYISTDAVFDGNDSRLYSEDDITNPPNVYGRTKLDGETAVLQYPENLVLRTNIYGLNIQKKQSFGEWIFHALKEDQTLHLFTDIYFSPILVNELAELIYLSCQKELCGLYHACGTGCINKYDFGMKLKEIFQLETGTIISATSDTAHFKARRSKHMGMSNERLRSALQVNISTPEESIKKFCDLCKRLAAGNLSGYSYSSRGVL